MRIAVMLRHLRDQRGGIGTLTRNLLSELLEIDRSNEYVLIYAHDEMRGRYSSFSHVTEVVAKAPSKLLWDQVVVPYLARRHQVDVIFNPKLSVPLATKRPSVFILAGGDWFVFPQNYKLYDRMYHSVFAPLYCRAARAVISISKSATDDILGAVAVDPAKLRTIHLGVAESFQRVTDGEQLSALRARYGLPERYVLWVGQIYPMKNLRGLIRAFAALRPKVPHKLVVVGKRELKYREDLALIGELGLENDVILTGWVPDEDLPGLYSAADLFAFPSLYEGFGMPILEAMACGCPVVTSDRGAMREVAGDAAILVDPADELSIADGIHEGLVNTELRRQVVERGFARVTGFSWEKCAREVLSLLESFNAEAGSTGDGIETRRPST